MASTSTHDPYAGPHLSVVAHIDTSTQPVLRVGAIGVDSSHTLQFSRRMYALHAQRETTCLVTCCWDPRTPSPFRSFDANADSTEASLRALGVQFSSSLEDLLESVDAVMVLTVDGHGHFELAMQALARGLPTFIDKPLTCSATQAASLLRFTQTHGERCYSASALRFIDKLPSDTNNALGRLVSIEASGPFQELAPMPGLWYYACHTFELVDSLWPRARGVSRIRARLEESGHRIELEYHDGRAAVIGLDRAGTAPFTAILRGEHSSFQFQAALASSYDRLVASMCRFFAGSTPEFPLENIAETISAIECAHRSLAQDGAWISLAQFPNPTSQNQGFSTRKNST